MSAGFVTQRGCCIVCGAGAGMVCGGGNLCGLGTRGRVHSEWGAIGLASGYEPPANGAQSRANAGIGAQVQRIAKHSAPVLGLGTSGLRGGGGSRSGARVGSTMGFSAQKIFTLTKHD
jgi:hypothetical protein